MRRLTLLIGAFAGAAALWLGTATPAAAGGPTSVLVVNAGSGEAAGLYGSSADYQALDRAVGEAGKPAAQPRLDELGGRRISLTWMLHDVKVWRVDQVYPDAGGGVLVNRRLDSYGEQQTEWFHAADQQRVKEILGRLRVLGPDTGGSMSAPDFPAFEPEAAPAPTPDPAPAASSARSATDNWWWALAGLAAGPALAVGAARGLRRLRERAEAHGEGAWQELVDV
ncbi:hypothetical protein AB0M28_17075 [Streptomyces sp. NPDC051940]|uniref:hypothetical protein n=1 Tax=Streptomyces sp. NPDC051940 TaxID=3155675 RepID=UPI00342EDCD2